MNDIDVLDRIPLSKINVNTRTKNLIKYANIAIEQLTAGKTIDLSETNLILYATAFVVTERTGNTPKNSSKPQRVSNHGGRKE